MSNLETIEKILMSSSERTEVTIDHEGSEKVFKLRPLTDGELTKLKKIEYQSFKFKVKIDDDGNKRTKKEDAEEAEVDTGEFTENQKIAMYHAIAWSLSSDEENVPVAVVEKFPRGMPDLLYEKVIEVSGLKPGDLTSVKKFLKDK